MNFTIPLTTPPGKYLVRVEHFNISPTYGQTQQFINCAQVEVTGAGGGTPGPTIKFPGAYDISDNSESSFSCSPLSLRSSDVVVLFNAHDEDAGHKKRN
jgi:hypothetical protein